MPLLTSCANGAPQVEVHSPEEPHLAAWKGGSLLASSPHLHSRLLMREAYLRHRQSVQMEFDDD